MSEVDLFMRSIFVIQELKGLGFGVMDNGGHSIQLVYDDKPIQKLYFTEICQLEGFVAGVKNERERNGIKLNEE